MGEIWMYQSLVNLLLEAGYQKYMSQIGPVYVLEQERERQIIFLTYHKNQTKEPVRLEEYQHPLLEIRDTIFPEQETKLLCILIVDDGHLMEEQLAGDYAFSVWVQDEITGKLYINEASEKEFSYLYHFVSQKGEEARKIMETQETKSQKSQWEELKVYLTPVNMGLIAVNIICFGAYLVFGDELLEKGVSIWSDIMINGQYYRLFTCMFLHFDWEHLFSNMLVLFLTGSFAERYLGSGRYLLVYLGSGLIGNMISFYFEIGSTELIWSAGASGAIYGVLGMLAVILIRTKGKLQGIEGPGLMILIAGSIFHSYQAAGVDNWSHLGGLAAGILFGLLMRKKGKE